MSRKKHDSQWMAEIGARGGKTTRRRLGSKHFRAISLKRKNFKGGRPRGQKPNQKSGNSTSV